MSEERLKEIKHSLDFQEIMLISVIETYDADLEGVEELLKEEKDLYNEVIRLQQENKQLKKQCNNLLKIVGDYNSRLNKAKEYNQKIYDTTENQTKLMAKINLEILGDKE